MFWIELTCYSPSGVSYRRSYDYKSLRNAKRNFDRFAAGNSVLASKVGFFYRVALYENGNKKALAVYSCYLDKRLVYKKTGRRFCY